MFEKLEKEEGDKRKETLKSQGVDGKTTTVKSIAYNFGMDRF